VQVVEAELHQPLAVAAEQADHVTVHMEEVILEVPVDLLPVEPVEPVEVQ
jgi:hypothetical protein